LEIGCGKNDLFNSVPASDKVGVDPVSGGTIRLSSDSFFKNNKDQYDFVFIDGLHEYSQAFNDLKNSINVLSKSGGWVFLHDMLPSSCAEQLVPRVSQSWTGDVWKILADLKASNVDFKVIAFDHGICAIRVRSKDKIVIEKVSENLDYLDYKNLLNSLPLLNSFDDFQLWVDSNEI